MIVHASIILRVIILLATFLRLSCQIKLCNVDKFLMKSESDQLNSLMERVMEILDTCPTDVTNKIGLLTDSNLSMIWVRKHLQRSTLIRINIDINNGSNLPENRPQSYNRQKLNAFILVLSASNTSHAFDKLKYLKLLHPTEIILMVDKNTVHTGCSNAAEFLSNGWNVDLLHCTFFCIQPEKGIVMYTLNPYASFAPKSWQKVELVKNDLTNTTGTLYSQQLFRGRTTCEDMNFDKTKNLGGYKTKAVLFTKLTMMDFNETKWENPKDVDIVITQSLFDKLNTTLAVEIITDFSEYGQVNENGTRSGILASMMSRKFDILINSRYTFNKFDTPMTYPHKESGICVMTRFAGLETAATKILNFMNRDLILGIIFVSIFTVIILSVSTGRGYVAEFLEVLRTVIGGSMKHLPRRSFLRIHLATVFALFLMTSATFQGNLASILTTPVLRGNVDSFKDLRESRHTIYYYVGLKKLLDGSIESSRLRSINDFNCVSQVIEKDAACIGDRSYLMQAKFNHNRLHISESVITTVTLSYVIRPHWPLTVKVNYILSLMKEAGLINYWAEESNARFIYLWNIWKKRKSKKRIRKLKMRDLAFAFFGLQVCLIFSTIVFLAELAVSRWLSNTVKIQIAAPKPVYPFVQ